MIPSDTDPGNSVVVSVILKLLRTCRTALERPKVTNSQRSAAMKMLLQSHLGSFSFPVVDILATSVKQSLLAALNFNCA